MILDATTAQLCTRYPRGSAMDEADLFYLCLFNAFRYLNSDFRSSKATRLLTIQYLTSIKTNLHTARKIADDIGSIISMSFVANKTDRLLCGVVETAEVDGIVYKVPIFALSNSTSLSTDGRPRFGVTIYDDLIYTKADENIIKNSFLYNITLYTLRQRCISLDYVEYIYKTDRDKQVDKQILGHKRMIISNPTFDLSLIKSYTATFKKNLPNMYHCGDCKYRLHCWGQTNAKNYK